MSLHKQLESETVHFVVMHLLQTLIKCTNRTGPQKTNKHNNNNNNNDNNSHKGKGSH